MGEVRRRGLSAGVLKMIALICMLIDHTGAVLVAGYCRKLSVYSSIRAYQLREQYVNLYHVMRAVGRIAFPLYCFLLVEGFFHTKSVRKYLLRLGIFAVLSEVPFDLAFYGKVWDFQHQNVYFTLFFGLSAIALMKWAERKWDTHLLLKNMALIAVILFFAAVALLLKTDYNAYGVIAILAFYVGRSTRIRQLICGGAAFWFEFPYAHAALIPIWLYSGKKGFSAKYFFYLFYPLHLLALYGAAWYFKVL